MEHAGGLNYDSITQQAGFFVGRRSHTHTGLRPSPPACTMSTPPPAGKRPDPSSAANSDAATVRHIDLDLEVDFATRRVRSAATLTVERLQRDCTEVVLDVHMLEIARVAVDDQPTTNYSVRPFSSYGSALHIPLPPRAADDDGDGSGDAGAACHRVRIEYQTSPESPSLDWMEPCQTAGKERSFLFSQGQSVLNRSFIPCMDSCSVRITYTARVVVPDPYVALMSATRLSPDAGEPVGGEGGDKKRLYRFEMTRSIPAYLLALAVGDLVSAEIGPRSRVWAEPAMLEAATAEFEGVTEKFLSVGEELYGPYVWGIYDLLVMPPGFPYGGMENPLVTFLTPCLIVGDGSLVDIVAHEISHSWFGNLVTNACWSEFYLNEGFTQYAQRRITDIVLGKEHTALEALAGWDGLLADIREFGADSPLTRLRVPLEGPEDDPEHVYNDVPYEKGYALVSYLRSLVGSDAAFDGWMKQYVADFVFQSITSEQMFAHFLAHFPDLAAAGVAHRAGFEFVETWLDKPGPPPFTPDHSPAKPLTDAADALAARLLALAGGGGGNGNSGNGGDDDRQPDSGDGTKGSPLEGWSTYQVAYLLDRLFARPELDSPGGRRVLAEVVGARWGVARSLNSEIAFRWSLLVAKFSVVACLDSVAGFLKRQGKQKYQVPVYRALYHNEGGGDPEVKAAMHAFARRVYQETRPALHANVRKYIAKAMHWTTEAEAEVEAA